MSAYKYKAQNNIITAETLLNNGLLLSSAHPAYYSVFLLIKFLLAHCFSVSYAQQETLTKKQRISQGVVKYGVNHDGCARYGNWK